jgi:hypothetical protein
MGSGMKAMTRGVNKLYKSYLFTVVARDLKRLADQDLRKQAMKVMRNVNFDRKLWLKRVGLMSYSPIRTGLGTGLLLLSGAIAGALLGLTMAPMRGQDFRQKIRGGAEHLMHRGMGETQAPAQA